MKIYDISMMIETTMRVYKNKEEKRPRLEVVKDFNSSDMFESRITMDMHTGTHIDAPLHAIKGGESIDKVELGSLITRCKVYDFTDVLEKLTEEDLIKRDIKEGDFILLKTRNSGNTEFDPEFIYLDESGAKYLLDIGIVGVGTDGLGIERNQKSHITHKILLGNDICIIEGLALKDVKEGEYALIALPLKIKGAEASPIRAVLVDGTIEPKKKK